MKRFYVGDYDYADLYVHEHGHAYVFAIMFMLMYMDIFERKDSCNTKIHKHYSY